MQPKEKRKNNLMSSFYVYSIVRRAILSPGFEQTPQPHNEIGGVESICLRGSCMETCPSSCAVFPVQWGLLSTKEKQYKQNPGYLAQKKGTFFCEDQKPCEEDRPVHKARLDWNLFGSDHYTFSRPENLWTQQRDSKRTCTSERNIFNFHYF